MTRPGSEPRLDLTQRVRPDRDCSEEQRRPRQTSAVAGNHGTARTLAPHQTGPVGTRRHRGVKLSLAPGAAAAALVGGPASRPRGLSSVLPLPAAQPPAGVTGPLRISLLWLAVRVRCRARRAPHAASSAQLRAAPPLRARGAWTAPCTGAEGVRLRRATGDRSHDAPRRIGAARCAAPLGVLQRVAPLPSPCATSPE